MVDQPVPETSQWEPGGLSDRQRPPLPYLSHRSAPCSWRFAMCSTASCSQCGKKTWAGCGEHVDAVMARVPSAQRCRCEPVPRHIFLERLRAD